MSGSRSRRFPVWGSALAIAAGVGAWFGAPPAQAEPIEHVRLEYSAPPTCPSFETFLAAVRGRTTRIRIASRDEPARAMAVLIEADAHGASGRVTIHASDGRDLRREVAGPSCEQVADVLALVVALAVDPDAPQGPRPSTSETPATATSAPIPGPVAPVASSAAPLPSSRPVSARPVPAPPAVAAEGERPRAASLAPTRTGGRAWSWSSGVGASGSSGVAPALLFGATAFVEARPAERAWAAPRIRLSFERTATDTLDVAAAGARFTWTVGRADLCAFAWRRGTVRAAPCAGVEAGALQAQGTAIDHARVTTTPWLAMGPLGRLEWTFLDPLFFEVEVFARAALLRPGARRHAAGVSHRLRAVRAGRDDDRRSGGVASASAGHGGVALTTCACALPGDHREDPGGDGGGSGGATQMSIAEIEVRPSCMIAAKVW